MEAEQFDFSVVFPNIAAQLRSVLGNLHLAAAQLAPAIRREGDPRWIPQLPCWIRATTACCGW